MSNKPTTILALVIDHEGDQRPLIRLPEKRYARLDYYVRKGGGHTHLNGIVYASRGVVLFVPEGQAMPEALEQQDPALVFIKGPTLLHANTGEATEADDTEAAKASLNRGTSFSDVLRQFANQYADQPGFMGQIARKAKLRYDQERILAQDPTAMTEEDARILAAVSVSEPGLFDDDFEPTSDDELTVRLQLFLRANRQYLRNAIVRMRQADPEKVDYVTFAIERGAQRLAEDLHALYTQRDAEDRKREQKKKKDDGISKLIRDLFEPRIPPVSRAKINEAIGTRNAQMMDDDDIKYLIAEALDTPSMFDDDFDFSSCANPNCLVCPLRRTVLADFDKAKQYMIDVVNAGDGFDMVELAKACGDKALAKALKKSKKAALKEDSASV